MLKTPPIDAGILEGITRGAVMELAHAAKIPVQETALTRHDVYIADECFLTGTAAEIIPVVKCDARVIGTGKPGPITTPIARGIPTVDARLTIPKPRVEVLRNPRILGMCLKIHPRVSEYLNPLNENKQ